MSIRNAPLPATDTHFFTQMVERQTDLQTVTQKVRLCRLKLGAVLNRLENYKLEPDALKLVNDRTDEISNEIRLLIEMLQRLLDD